MHQNRRLRGADGDIPPPHHRRGKRKSGGPWAVVLRDIKSALGAPAEMGGCGSEFQLSLRTRHRPPHLVMTSRKSGSHATLRWREMDSNPRSPVSGAVIFW